MSSEEWSQLTLEEQRQMRAEYEIGAMKAAYGDGWLQMACKLWPDMTPQQQQVFLLAQFEADRRRERIGVVIIACVVIVGLIALGSWANGWIW